MQRGEKKEEPPERLVVSRATRPKKKMVVDSGEEGALESWCEEAGQGTETSSGNGVTSRKSDPPQGRIGREHRGGIERRGRGALESSSSPRLQKRVPFRLQKTCRSATEGLRRVLRFSRAASEGKKEGAWGRLVPEKKKRTLRFLGKRSSTRGEELRSPSYSR